MSVEVEVFPEFTTGVINESAPICYNGIPDMIQYYNAADRGRWLIHIPMVPV